MINYTIDKFTDREIFNLAQECKLDEDLDYFCNFVIARDSSDKLIAVAGVNFTRLAVPKFEHIIITPRYQKSKLLVVIMRHLENLIISRGHKGYISFILNKNKHMQDYAMKWGMRPYNVKAQGIWFDKKIGG